MPLPTDEETLKLSHDLTNTLRGAFGTPNSLRPVHARGALAKGTFTASATAASLTKAYHFNAPSTPITVRFSSSTGIPAIPDTDPNANPRGIAVRFQLPDVDGRRHHTDIIAHSTPFFPVRTGELFLQFLGAIGSGRVPEFVGDHSSALAFVQAPKLAPESLGSAAYWSVNAFKLTNADGKVTFVRYRFVPTVGEKYLTAEETAAKPSSYLYDGIASQLPFTFKLVAQVAEEGDVTDDATVHWPETRQIIELGEVKVETLIPEAEQGPAQQKIIYDPIPRGVDGVEPSNDPLLEQRAGVYLVSGKIRREAHS